MDLHAPNPALFVIAGCVAVLGILASLPIGLPMPGIIHENAAWYVFLGWFLLSAGTVLRPRAAKPSEQ